MEICINPKSKGLIVKRGKEELTWELKTWPRVTDSTTVEMFGQLNDWIALWPQEKQESVWKLYVQARDVLDHEDIASTRDEILSQVCCGIADSFEIATLSEWLVTPGDEKVWIDPSFEEFPNPDHPQAQTYTRPEYIELCAMTIALKALLPIWGVYNNIASHESGSDRKEMRALELLNDSRLIQSNPAIRLYDYADAWAEKKKKISQAALTKDLAAEDIPLYFQSILMVRRLTTHALSFQLKHAIQDAYNYINSRAQELISGPNDKKSKRGGGDEEQESVTESIRLAQDIQDYIITSQDVYIEDYVTFFKDHLKEEATEENFARFKEIYDGVLETKNLVHSEFHTLFAVILLDDEIYAVLADKMNGKAMRVVIALMSFVLERKGYHDLSILARAERFEKDPLRMTMGGIAMKSVPPALVAEMDEKLYPYEMNTVTSKGRGRLTSKPATANPGMIAIAAVVKLINSYEWSFATQDMYTLRISLAKLLLEEGK